MRWMKWKQMMIVQKMRKQCCNRKRVSLNPEQNGGISRLGACSLRRTSLDLPVVQQQEGDKKKQHVPRSPPLPQAHRAPTPLQPLPLRPRPPATAARRTCGARRAPGRRRPAQEAPSPPHDVVILFLIVVVMLPTCRNAQESRLLQTPGQTRRRRRLLVRRDLLPEPPIPQARETRLGGR